MTESVVITGSGIITSLGDTTDTVWASLLSGRSGLTPLVHPDPCCGPAALVQGLDPAGLGIHPRDARIMGKHAHMLIKASREAHAAAAIDRATLSPEEIGFFAGMGMVDYRIEDLLPGVLKSLREDGSLDYEKFYTSGYREIHPLWPLSMLNNISFCQAAIGLTIRGENTVFSPHADSGALAIAEGVRTLLENRARLVFAGGVSEVVSPLSVARGNCMGILPPATERTAAGCRPFGSGRMGTLLGEGSGIVCLETRAHAEARGAAYNTMITGFGLACGRDRQAPCPSVPALSAAMQQALDSAGLASGQIDLLIAHGDGTAAGDRNEAEAISAVFTGAAGLPPVYASKAALGNLLSGAAAVDLILAARMLTEGKVPPVAGDYLPDNSLNIRLVQDRPLAGNLRRIMINALSYEGQCSSLIIEAVTD